MVSNLAQIRQAAKGYKRQAESFHIRQKGGREGEKEGGIVNKWVSAMCNNSWIWWIEQDERGKGTGHIRRVIWTLNMNMIGRQ